MNSKLKKQLRAIRKVGACLVGLTWLATAFSIFYNLRNTWSIFSCISMRSPLLCCFSVQAEKDRAEKAVRDLEGESTERHPCAVTVVSLRWCWSEDWFSLAVPARVLCCQGAVSCVDDACIYLSCVDDACICLSCAQRRWE